MAGNDWFPIRLFFADGGWIVDMARLGTLRFEDPFFHQTVQRALRRPFNLAFRRQLPLAQFLAENESAPANADVAGLIFHLSRCGSTLVSQSLAALPNLLVLSEAAPIDEAVRADRYDAHADTAWKVRTLRALLRCYRGLFSHGCDVVLKLDAWHALWISLLTDAFPGAPRIFVYRDPAEILVSHERQFAWMMAALNAPSLLDISVADAMALERHTYRARLLARICERVAGEFEPGDLLVHYDELPQAVCERVAAHFGITLSTASRAAMRAAASRDTKRPTRTFAPDGAEKRAEVTPEIAQAVECWMRRPYRELEARRQTQRAKATGVA